MTPQALAARLVVYSDTVTAFALVNGLAFLITLSDPDIRCSIAAVAWVAFAANTLVPAVSTWALFWLRGYQARLRQEAEEEEESPLVSAFWRRLFVIRLVLIWTFSVVVLLGIFGATRDSRCDLPIGLAG